jgi:hypothetical protein
MAGERDEEVGDILVLSVMLEPSLVIGSIGA